MINDTKLILEIITIVYDPTCSSLFFKIMGGHFSQVIAPEVIFPKRVGGKKSGHGVA